MRKLCAYILLTVFLSMTIFTDFHRHRIVSPIAKCEMCGHNIPHPDHISQSYSYQDLCLLCHWASEEFTSDVKTLAFCNLQAIKTQFADVFLQYSFIKDNSCPSRAPPQI
ncbi:MAG: hypothetical protein J6M30_07850 [Bacteroidales bacterium]|nr:hypothetical protein [Bacteroidales bacterium]